jgi:hypothetical protein
MRRRPYGPRLRFPKTELVMRARGALTASGVNCTEPLEKTTSLADVLRFSGSPDLEIAVGLALRFPWLAVVALMQGFKVRVMPFCDLSPGDGFCFVVLVPAAVLAGRFRDRGGLFSELMSPSLVSGASCIDAELLLMTEI